MKPWLNYLLGVISGVAITLAVISIVDKNETDNDDVKFIKFDEPGDCLSTNSFKVIQVIDDHCALALELSPSSAFETFLGTLTGENITVLLTNDEGKYYYDDQEIKVPTGKCMRQVGIFRYTTEENTPKAIPIAKVMDM